MSAEPTNRRDFLRGLVRETARQSAPLVMPSGALSFATLGDGQAPMPRALGPARTASVAELRELSSELGLEHHGDELVELARWSTRLIIEEPASWPILGRLSTPDSDAGRPEALASGRSLLRLAIAQPCTDQLGVDGGTIWCALTSSSACEVTVDHERAASSVAWAMSPTKALAVHAETELVLPRAWDRSVEELGLDAAGQDAWQLLRRRLADLQCSDLPGERPASPVIHRLFGYPDDRRGDMPLACELLSRGMDVGSRPPRMHARAAELEPLTARWRLLLQLSSDDRLNWEWGSGTQRMYVWIDRDDLARGDLSRTQTIVR
jgi:hypothetical protein